MHSFISSFNTALTKHILGKAFSVWQQILVKTHLVINSQNEIGTDLEYFLSRVCLLRVSLLPKSHILYCCFFPGNKRCFALIHGLCISCSKRFFICHFAAFSKDQFVTWALDWPNLIKIWNTKPEVNSNAVDKFSCVLFLFGSHFREPQAALDPGLPLCQVSQPSELNCAEPVPSVPMNDVSKSSGTGTAAVELHTAQPNAPEDPVSVIDSILNENNSGNQNDPLLDRY